VCDQYFTEDLKQYFLEKIGLCFANIEVLNMLLKDEVNMQYDQARDLEIGRLRAIVNVELEDLPDISMFENLNKNCDDDIFLETLLNEIRNRALSVQSNLYKLRTLKLDNLNACLKTLKMDYGANANAIFEIEREITGLLDSELKETLLNFKKFAILNQEKLTPHFMNLVKKKNRMQM
jgi:hypothetical protein